ncbi:MAG: hypothetical protein FJ010_00920 [Chloroflexi bacterium]|nr:hypothetical protein [Chloroflexota bacterium]
MMPPYSHDPRLDEFDPFVHLAPLPPTLLRHPPRQIPAKLAYITSITCAIVYSPLIVLFVSAAQLLC